jgi:hypothetical protein
MKNWLCLVACGGDDPSRAWSIGGSPETEVEGHTIVIHDPANAMAPVACGTIYYLYPI